MLTKSQKALLAIIKARPATYVFEQYGTVHYIFDPEDDDFARRVSERTLDALARAGEIPSVQGTDGLIYTTFDLR